MNKLAFNQTLDNFGQQFSSWAEYILSMLPEIILAMVLLATTFFLSKLIYGLTVRLIANKVSQQSVGRLIARATSTLIVFAGLFLALKVVNLGKSVTGLLAGAGISGLILGLAFQSTLSNTISGVVLAFRRNVKVGDWIETLDFRGEITEIALNYTVIREADNNLVVIPNKTMLETPMKNYSLTSGIRVTLSGGVAYDSPLEQVEEIALATMRELSDMTEMGRPPEFYFTEFGDSSINFLCRFWIKGENGQAKLSSRSAMIMKLKNEFDKHDIVIPFPIRTLEFKNQEAFSTVI